MSSPRSSSAFPAFLGAVVLLGIKRGALEVWIAPALVAAQFAGALLAYATGRNEIQWWLETSADRLLTQMAPLAVLAVGVAFHTWAESEPAPAPAPPPEAPERAKGKRRKKR